MRRTGAVTVISARGDIDLATTSELTDVIDAVLADDMPSALIIDLTEVTFLASAGMTVLIETHQRVAGRTHFAVIADGPATHRPLTLMGLDTIFAVHNDLEVALASFGC